MDPDTIQELFAVFGAIKVRHMFGGAGLRWSGECAVHCKRCPHNYLLRRQLFDAAGFRPKTLRSSLGGDRAQQKGGQVAAVGLFGGRVLDARPLLLAGTNRRAILPAHD